MALAVRTPELDQFEQRHARREEHPDEQAVVNAADAGRHGAEHHASRQPVHEIFLEMLHCACPQ